GARRSPTCSHRPISGKDTLGEEGTSDAVSKYFDVTVTALAAWLLCGLFADGWAHNHLHVESFFTPWHAVLYSGYLANAVFYITTAIRGRRKGRTWRAAVPPGYGLASVGGLGFG